jgi:hypothetical protein
MNFRDSASVSAVLLLVGVMMLAPAVSAAVPTFDTESTDTTTTSDYSGGETITDFTANDSKHIYLEASGMTADGEFQFRDPDLNLSIYTNSSLAATDSANNYYAANDSHAALKNFPMDSGENVTVTIRAVNDTTVDDPDTKDINITLDNVDTRVVRYVDTSQVSSESDSDALTQLDTDGFNVPLTDMSIFADDFAKVQEDDVSVAGNDTTIRYHFANSSSATRFDDRVSNLDSGVWQPAIVASVGGENLKVYADEAPDSVESGDSYGVYHADEDAIVFHLGDDYEDESTVDVSVNSKAGWYAQFQAYGASAFTNGTPLESLTGLLFIFGSTGNLLRIRRSETEA